MTKIHHSFIEADKLRPWKEHTCGVCSIGNSNADCSVELSDFDYAVIEYSWTEENGSELDTRTYISAPDRKNKTIGWNRLANDEEYLIWGGDNEPESGSEYRVSEAVLCNFNLIRTAFNDSEIKISLNTFWWGTSVNRRFNVLFKTYKNGSMVKNGFTWDNVDGQLIQEFNFQAMADNSNADGDIDGFIVGEIVYARATNSFILKKDCLDPIDPPIDPPITECNAKPLSMSFPNYILVPEGASVVTAVNSNIGGQTGSDIYSLNPGLYRTTEEGKAVNLLNFIEHVLYSYSRDNGDSRFHINMQGVSVDMDLCDVGYREFYIRPEPDTRYSNNQSRLILVVDGVQYNLPIQTVDKTYDPTEANITNLLTSACQAIVDLGIPATLENYEVFGVQKLHIKIGPALNRINGYSEFGSGWYWESTGHRIISCVENVNSNYLNEPASISIDPIPAYDPEAIDYIPTVPGYTSISFSPVANKSPADIDVFDLITFSNTEKECVSCNIERGE